MRLATSPRFHFQLRLVSGDWEQGLVNFTPRDLIVIVWKSRETACFSLQRLYVLV